MPHRFSAVALEARRERARRRGYVSSVPPGFSMVCVPTSIATRVKEMAQSIAIHRQHIELVGFGTHYARSATAAAASHQLISPDSCKAAMAAHRTANRAKHAWRARCSQQEEHGVDAQHQTEEPDAATAVHGSGVLLDAAAGQQEPVEEVPKYEPKVERTGQVPLEEQHKYEWCTPPAVSWSEVPGRSVEAQAALRTAKEEETRQPQREAAREGEETYASWAEVPTLFGTAAPFDLSGGFSLQQCPVQEEQEETRAEAFVSRLAGQLRATVDPEQRKSILARVVALLQRPGLPTAFGMQPSQLLVKVEQLASEACSEGGF
jgi:hypothetical protein